MNNDSNLNASNELDLRELFLFTLKKKYFLLILIFLFGISSTIIALTLPNIYTATTILAPTKQDNSLSAQLSSYSSLASLSGISIPNENTSKTEEAIQIIKTFYFLHNLLHTEKGKEDIIAVKKWDYKKNKIIYKKSIFDSENNKWVREVSYPKMQVPSNQEAYKAFMRKLSITIDKKNQFVSISVRHHSPVVAKNWIELIVYNINESMRKEDMELSETYINFLNESQKSTNLQSLQEASSKLLENQMQTLMLASSSKAYIFKTIESPVVPEEKSAPNRPLILLLGLILGTIFSMFIISIKFFRENFQ